MRRRVGTDDDSGKYGQLNRAEPGGLTPGVVWAESYKYMNTDGLKSISDWVALRQRSCGEASLIQARNFSPDNMTRGKKKIMLYNEIIIDF
jgi:hypothetical protein